MEKRRNSRPDISSTHLSTVGDNSSHNDLRLSRSSRVSDIELEHIADGFQPAGFQPVSPISPSTSPGPLDERRHSLRRSLSLPVENAANNRSSIAKGGNYGIGLAMSEEHLEEESGASSENYFDPNTSRFNDRPNSSASTSHYSPSSPYRTRISRVSFSYPRRPTTPTGSQIQPAHPYALYQQTTFEEPEDVEEAHTQTIPIGFTGRTNTFQRRTGPHGEELEVVGPDGHTEELPPYSRYPVAGPAQKTPVMHGSPVSPMIDAGAGASGSHSANISPIIPSNAVSPLQPSLPGTPQVSNINDIPQLQRSQSQIQPYMHQPIPTSRSPTAPTTNSLTSNASRGVQSSASSLAEEKNRKSGGWSSIRRKRVLCGVVPLWALILVSVLALFLAIIAGGVLGGMLSQQRDKKPSRKSPLDKGEVAPMWDAKPIPAPTGIPPLPTGSFFFPLGDAEQQERSCIVSSRDSIAWSCNTPPTLMLMDFQTNIVGSAAKLTLKPAPVMAGVNGTAYGPQPPQIGDQALMWVTDVRDPGRGPALHFQTAYDKVVIFEGNSFPNGNIQRRKADLEKRHDMMPIDQGFHNHRFANTPGETPWYCYWNQTYIEGFIFVQQPVQGAETQRFTVSSMSVMHSQLVLPTKTAGSTTSFSPSTATASTTSSDIQTPQKQLNPRATLFPRHDADPSSSSTQTPTTTTSSSATTTQTNPPSRFPFIVKIEERRLPNPLFTPFCQRMQVDAQGSASPMLKDGNPIVEVLREAPANTADAQVTAGVVSGQSGHRRKNSDGRSAGRRVRRWEATGGSVGEVERTWEFGVDGDGKARLLRRNSEPGNSCHCVWVSPYN